MELNRDCDSLNILLVLPHYNTLDHSSNLRSSQIGSYLAACGHTVTTLAPAVNLRTGQLFEETRGRIYHESDLDGVRLIRTYSLPAFRRSAFHRLLFEIIYAVLTFIKALTIRGVDVVVASYPPAVAPFSTLLVSKILRVPVIFEVRDLMAGALSATGYVKANWFNRVAVAAERFMAKRCDHIICVSNGIKQAFVTDYGIDPDKISVNTNGYEPNVFAAAEYSWKPRERYTWGNRFVAIYAGGLTNAYDIPTLLRAAERLKDDDDLLFVIVGDGDRKQEYIEFCSDRRLSNCQFLPPHARRQMPLFFADADVGLHLFPDDPLWSYVLGNKTFDYLGSGLPMIYAGTGDTADLINEAEAGIVVQPEDDRALSAAISYLKTHPEIAREMGNRGQDFVTTHYARPKLVAEFESILRKTARK